MQTVRRLAKKGGFDLPDNCLRHSFITYRVAQIQDKAKVAAEAGNSVKEQDKRYRVPTSQARGDLWFSLTAAKCEELATVP